MHSQNNPRYAEKIAIAAERKKQFDESGLYLPFAEMQAYWRSLPQTNSVRDKELHLTEKICIVTHDDEFDQEMFEYEESLGIQSTFYLLPYRNNADLKQYAERTDLQFHFDKFYGHIPEQQKMFTDSLEATPIANRNHFVAWRANHIDLLYLAQHGIRVDSTLFGTQRPFRLSMAGKLLPIWELPTQIADGRCFDLGCTYTVSNDVESLFASNFTPIVALYHPYLKDKNDWKEIYRLGKKYGYTFMSVAQFHKKYLETQ